eukprot:TRINITY_DN7871_c0_g2_i2.p1 TRINITY_DN7871_c0_g2~~TRINITY_DN7871_c0_g2_i2.p1  ORF type:complete len:111 (+),score=25.62 TRINITY_DN7871_c0_g2_i2:147-479(+)
MVEQNACGLVVGFPLLLDGSEGDQCMKVRHFVASLRQGLSLEQFPVYYWDERRSTKYVRDTFLAVHPQRKKLHQKDTLDCMAATYILQGFLDAVHQQQKPNNAQDPKDSA